MSVLCQEKLNQDLSEIIINSGRYFNQIGAYNECIQNSAMKYAVLFFLNATSMVPIKNVFMGSCVPVQCDRKILQQLANKELVSISSPVLVSTIYDRAQTYDFAYDWVFYFTAVIVALLVLLAIIATLIPKFKLIRDFNIAKNLQIFKFRPNNLNVFNGIKSLCMIWVILGHQFSIRMQNVVNVTTLEKQTEKPFFLLVEGGFLAVDVFFWIGGFLVAFSVLRAHTKKLIKYPMAIVHRVLRFWPSYIMTLLIFYSVYLHLGGGPLWWQIQSPVVQPCNRMWKPLLFVDNLVDNGADMCMGWGWYLQNDMQIFIYCMLLLLIYSKNRLACFGLSMLTCLGSWIYSFVVTYINNYVHVAHVIDFLKWNEYFTNIYIKPWIRCPPYIFGLVLGIFYIEYLNSLKSENVEDKEGKLYYKIQQSLKASKIKRFIMELFGLGIMIFVVYIPRTLQLGVYWSQTLQSLYLTFSPILFVIGATFLLLPSLLGVKSMVSFMMDTTFFSFIGKISFWTYLIHYMVVMRTDYNQKVDFYYTSLGVLPQYSAHVLLSMFFGFMGTVLVEIPFSKLEKKMFEIFMPAKKQALNATISSNDSIKQSLVSVDNRFSLNSDKQ